MSSCRLCQSKKSPFCCDFCNESVCKNCSKVIEADQFSFFSKMPEVLLKERACLLCYDQQVLPQVQKYDELMEKAKDVYYVSNNHKGYIRIYLRHTKPFKAGPCPDRRECILRLAFFAAELGFNAIIEGEVDYSKVRKQGGYQTSTWEGTALGANIDGEHLERASARGF